MRFKVDEVALELVVPEFFGFLSLIILPPLLCTRLSTPHGLCSSPDQAAHYLNVGLLFGTLCQTWHLVGLSVWLFMKPEFSIITLKNSVCTTKKMHYLTITKIMLLILFKKIIPFYSEYHMKPINAK
jgi:hypothetical protein